MKIANIRRLISGLIFFGILSVVYPQTSIVTSIGHYTANPGDTLEMPVRVTNFTDINSISLILNYNPLVLSYAGFKELHPLISPVDILINGAQAGKIALACFSVSGLSIPDTVTLVVFKLVYQTGATNLIWDSLYCDYTNIVGMPYPAIYENGTVNGGCPPVFEHTISYSVSQLSVSFSTSTALGVAPYTYAWEFGDGQSSNLQNPVHTYATASNFYVTLTAMDALFCQHDTTITLLSGIFTGIPDGVAKTADPILFPNPARDQIFLEIQSGQELPVSYEIYDLAGKLIISQTELFCNGNKQYHIQTSYLKPGMYFLRINTKSGFNSISKFTILK